MMEQVLLIALLVAIVPIAIFLSVKRMRTEGRLLRAVWKALTGRSGRPSGDGGAPSTRNRR